MTSTAPMFFSDRTSSAALTVLFAGTEKKPPCCSPLALQRRRELCDRPVHLGGRRFRHALRQGSCESQLRVKNGSRGLAPGRPGSNLLREAQSSPGAEAVRFLFAAHSALWPYVDPTAPKTRPAATVLGLLPNWYRGPTRLLPSRALQSSDISDPALRALQSREPPCRRDARAA
jgi:hypothetical protein